MPRTFLVTERTERTYRVTMTDEYLAREANNDLEVELCAADAIDDPRDGCDVRLTRSQTSFETQEQH